MDNLPKNQSGDDLTSFAGSYPDDTAGQNPTSVNPQPPFSSASPAPFVTEPVVSQPVQSVQTQPYVSPPPPPVNEPLPPAFGDSFTAGGASIPPSSFPNEGTIPSAPPPENNPFIAPAAPPRGSGALKRVLLIILLIALLVGLGFLAFTLVGRFLTQSQPVVLNYWGLWENEQVITNLIQEYEKTHPKVQVVYAKQSPKQYRERLDAAIRRGEGPDLFRYHNTWVPMFKDVLAPSGSTGYTSTEFQQTFYPVATQDLVLNGQVYGVPLMFDGLGLYYNEDILRSGGVTPPTTWEDFRNAAYALTVKNEAGQIVTAGAALGTTSNIEHFSDILAVMMLQNGADLTNPTSKEAIEALSFYHLFAEQPNNVWDASLDNSITAFANGKVAFMFAPSWEVFTLREINPQLKFQIIPIPQLPQVTVNWASYWAEGVSNKSKYKDEAWEFLKFLSSKESMIKLYTEQSKLRPFGEPYSRTDLAQTVINDPFVGAYMRQAPTAQSFFLASRTFDNGINDQMIKYAENAINSLGQSVSPEAALGTMAQGFAEVLSRYGYTPSQR